MGNNELYCVVGGALNGTLINSIIKVFDRILDFGRTVGSAIRYGFAKKSCSV